MKSFYNETELRGMGFNSLGANVLISKMARLYDPSTISIGNNVRIDDFCILTGDIELGSHIHIGAYSALFGGGGIKMHDFSGTSSRVSVYSTADSFDGSGMSNPCIPDKYRSVKSGLVEFKKHVLVGAGSVILPYTVLGEGASVGALSLVHCDLRSWSIYAGVPARMIGKRKKEIIYKYEREMMEAV